MPSLRVAGDATPLTQGIVLDEVQWQEPGPSPPLGIVLTNVCDIENQKAESILCAALVPAGPVLQATSEFRDLVMGADGSLLSSSKWRSLAKTLEGVVRNQRIGRYYFIDGTAVADYFLADFQKLISLSLSTALRAPSIAFLEVPDREHLVSRFAAYTTRVGVAEPEADGIREAVAALAAPYRQRPPS